MKNQNLKDNIICELKSLKELDMADQKLIDDVGCCKYDHHIEDLECISVTEATDLIIDLSKI